MRVAEHHSALPAPESVKSIFYKVGILPPHSLLLQPLNPSLLCAGEDAWRCQGCGDYVAPNQRLYRTVSEAWHTSCFR